MKKFLSFLSPFQPLYVIVSSLFGFALINILFVWTFPVGGDDVGERFTNGISYPVLVFEFGALLAFLSVVFLPLWKEFIELFKEQTSGRELKYKSKLHTMMIVGSVAFVAAWLFFIELTLLNPPAAPDSWPQTLNERVGIVYVYIFIVLLPIVLTNLLIYDAIINQIKTLSSNDQDEKILFGVAHELLRYRTLLQHGLLSMGIVASAVPITAATLRSIVIVLDPATESTFSSFGVIVYGLVFSAILILFYAPTHLMLVWAANELRDTLCPISDFSDLETNLKKRKNLDEWLRINISLVDNLKTSFIALSPLLTSFIATLGIKVT